MPTPMIKLRPPSVSSVKSSNADFIPPTTDWLSGTWHVTHSTLPMWKSNRNVTITYTPLSRIYNGMPQLEDTVRYRPLHSETYKTILGVDTYSAQSSGAWDWRGKGLLWLISSHWEVLGYGEIKGGGQWAVTFFASTLFSPTGIDIYCRTKDGLPGGILEGIKSALHAMDDGAMRALAKEVFEVRND